MNSHPDHVLLPTSQHFIMADACVPPHNRGCAVRLAGLGDGVHGFLCFHSGVSGCACFQRTAEALLFADSQDDSEDQSKVIVGVVVGLLMAAALMGCIYWLYMKNSRYEDMKSICIKHLPKEKIIILGNVLVRGTHI